MIAPLQVQLKMDTKFMDTIKTIYREINNITSSNLDLLLFLETIRKPDPYVKFDRNWIRNEALLICNESEFPFSSLHLLPVTLKKLTKDFIPFIQI